MKERLTIKDVKEYLENLDPKFDDSSVAIMKPGNLGTILDLEIATKESLGIVLSPTTDKERQSMLAFCSREDSEKIEEIYKKHRYGDTE